VTTVTIAADVVYELFEYYVLKAETVYRTH